MASSLLKEILANPGDAGLRGVYADELERAGDPRGEYITIELRLAGGAIAPADRAGLLQRRAELRREHGATWWPELPESRVLTRAGFAEAIAPFGSELGLISSLFEREPITRLELLDWPTAIREAAWHHRITRIAAHGRGELEAELQPFLASPLADGVEHLALTDLHIRDFGFMTTGGRYRPRRGLGEALPRCRKLTLAGLALDDMPTDPRRRRYNSRLERLLDWRHLDRLELLDLSCSQLSARAVTSLMKLELPALRVLRLSGNALGADGARALAGGLPRLRALARLDLIDAGVGSFATQLQAYGLDVRLDVPRPERTTLEIAGSVVDLDSLGGSSYAAFCDGRRLPIRVRTRPEGQVYTDAVGDTAELADLARGLAIGASRRPVFDGVVVRSSSHVAKLSIGAARAEVLYEPGHAGLD